MFEFHGWAVVKSSADRISNYPQGPAQFEATELSRRLEEEDGRDNYLFDNLKTYINNLSQRLRPSFHLQMTIIGHRALTVSGLLNHRDTTIFELFEWLGINGDRSYGFLFTQDDEDTDRSYNSQVEFRIFRLSRGKFQELDMILPTNDFDEIQPPPA